jgi:cytochrome d ubiquinol oxidase subunit II
VSLAEVVAAVMFTAIIAYAVLGGADFGSGIWDLLAGDARSGASTRRLVDHAIGPVWEANHVWFVFVLVFLWTAFPPAFAAIMRSLAVPFWLVGLGIVLRGASFAFRHYAPSFRFARATGITFALSSLVTPFFMGTIIGSIASGRVPLEGTATGIDTWLNPTSILGGALAVLTCMFLAGVFLASEAEATGQPDLADSIRRRAIVVGAVTGAVALAGVVPLRADADALADGLMGSGVLFVIASALAGVATMALLVMRRLGSARLTAVVAVVSVVAGWGAAQYPYVLADQATIDEVAGARSTLAGLLVGSVLAAVLVVPPLVYLFVLADTNRVGSDVDLNAR